MAIILIRDKDYIHIKYTSDEEQKHNKIHY